MAEPNDWRARTFRASVVEKLEEAKRNSQAPMNKTSAEMEEFIFQKANSKVEYVQYVTKVLNSMNNEQNKKKAELAAQQQQQQQQQQGQQVMMGPGGMGQMGMMRQPPQAGPVDQDPINALQNLAGQRSAAGMMARQQPQMGGMMQGGMSGMVNPQQPQAQHQQQQPGMEMMRPPYMQPGRPGPQQQMNPGMHRPPQMTRQDAFMVTTPQSMPGMPSQPLPASSINMVYQGPGGPIRSMGPMGVGGQYVQGRDPNIVSMPMQGPNQGSPLPMMPSPMGSHQGMMPSPVGGRPQLGVPSPNTNLHTPVFSSLPPSPSLSTQPSPNHMISPAHNPSTLRQSHISPPLRQRMPTLVISPQTLASYTTPPPPYPGAPLRNLMFSPSPPSKSPLPTIPSPYRRTSSISPPNTLNFLPPLRPSPSKWRTLGNPVASTSACVSPVTPNAGGAVQEASPAAPNQSQEELEYVKMLDKLSRYIEPVRKAVQDSEKKTDEESIKNNNKMKGLLSILTDRKNRVKMEVLKKCEQALLKLTAQTTPSTDSHMCQSLLDAVARFSATSSLNHSLYRSFGPALEAYTGPAIKAPSPPPSRKRKLEPENKEELPDMIQGEIARLGRRFVVSVDQRFHAGSDAFHLVCRLEEVQLPSVPPLLVTLPKSYPKCSPQCDPDACSGYDATEFFRHVADNLKVHLAHMPNRFCLTQLLTSWEMSVRKACDPDNPSICKPNPVFV